MAKYFPFYAVKHAAAAKKHFKVFADGEGGRERRAVLRKVEKLTTSYVFVIMEGSLFLLNGAKKRSVRGEMLMGLHNSCLGSLFPHFPPRFDKKN
jgi:hypothetical protein